MKRTYQPSKTRRARTHGFLVRMATKGGRAVIGQRHQCFDVENFNRVVAVESKLLR